MKIVGLSSAVGTAAATFKSTAEIMEGYVAKHRGEPALLEALITIAEEGEDAGDTPWAAANELEEFPAELLRPYVSRLRNATREGRRWAKSDGK